MANEKNLKPFDSSQSREEAQKNGKKGGIASGEARRRKRDARKAAQIILNLPATGKLKENLESMGLPEEETTNMMALMARMFVKVQAGDVNAARFLIEMAGGGAKHELERKEVSIDQKKLEFEKQKYRDQIDGTGASSAVDDWVDSVLEANGDETKNGKK